MCVSVSPDFNPFEGCFGGLVEDEGVELEGKIYKTRGHETELLGW